MPVSHRFTASSAVFDDEHLVSYAGLVAGDDPAEQSRLSALLEQKVRFTRERITSGAANLSSKLTTLIAWMCAGADSIDDLDVVRSGGMKTLFDGVYAPSTIRTWSQEFISGMPANSSRSCASIWAVCVKALISCPAPRSGRSSIPTHCCARSTATPSAGARFSLVLTKSRTVAAAIDSLSDDAWRPAPTQPLAMDTALAHPVAQHHRPQPTSHHGPLTTRRKAQPEHTGKAGQTSDYTLPTTQSASRIKPATPQRGRSTDRG